MPDKNSVDDWSATPTDNDNLAGLPLGTGLTYPSHTNNLVQGLMSQVKKKFATVLPDTSSGAPAGTDLNTVVEPGWSPLLHRGTQPNGWQQGWYGYVFVSRHGAAQLTQFVLPYRDGKMAYRDRYDGSWSGWTFVNTSNQTVSTGAPSGGVDGDVWYQV